MANSAITASVATSAASFAAAVRKHVWDASTLDSFPTKRAQEWKDWVDAVIVALQAEAGTDAAAAVASLTATGTVQAEQLTSTDDAAITDLLTAGRLDLSLGATLNANGTDFALSAGWGGGATVVEASVEGTGSRFRLTVTPGTDPTANPTITLTYPAARPAVPSMAIPVIRNYNAAGGITGISVDSLSTTVCVLQVIGTPVEANDVTFDCLVIG